MKYEEAKQKFLREQKESREANGRKWVDLLDRFGIYFFLFIGVLFIFSGNTITALLFFVLSTLFGLDLTIETRFRTLDAKLNELLKV